MVCHDDSGTSYYNCALCYGYDGNQIFAVSYFSGKQADAKVCTIPWKGVAGSDFRNARGILLKKRKCTGGKSRFAGIDCDYTGGSASFVETEYVTFHCGGDGVLYVVSAACVLTGGEEKCSITNYNSVVW